MVRIKVLLEAESSSKYPPNTKIYFELIYTAAEETRILN
jgi:hypothetical protein